MSVSSVRAGSVFTGFVSLVPVAVPGLRVTHDGMVTGRTLLTALEHHSSNPRGDPEAWTALPHTGKLRWFL